MSESPHIRSPQGGHFTVLALLLAVLFWLFPGGSLDAQEWSGERAAMALNSALTGSEEVLEGGAAGQGAPLSCILHPNTVSELSSPVVGVIAEMLVARGDVITRDQPLFRLDDRVDAAAVTLARARERFLQRKVARNQELIRDQLMSEHERDELETDALLARLEREQAAAALSLKNIRSPMDGYVLQRLAQVGEYVGEEPVLKIASLDPLFAEVMLPEARHGTVTVGTEVTVEILAPTPLTRQGRVVVVDPVIDAGSETFAVRVEIPNPAPILPAGLKCRIPAWE